MISEFLVSDNHVILGIMKDQDFEEEVFFGMINGFIDDVKVVDGGFAFFLDSHGELPHRSKRMGGSGNLSKDALNSLLEGQPGFRTLLYDNKT
jgi:hypothetical protein